MSVVSPRQTRKWSIPTSPSSIPIPIPLANQTPEPQKLHDRLLFLLSMLAGKQVVISLRSGGKVSGTLSGAGTVTGNLEIVLSSAVTEAEPGNVKRCVIVRSVELESLVCKAVELNAGGGYYHSHQQQGRRGSAGIRTDEEVSHQTRRTSHSASSGAPQNLERELQPWTAPPASSSSTLSPTAVSGSTQPALSWADEVDAVVAPSSSGGQALGDKVGAKGWDQFAANEKLFGVGTNFNEEEYTTKLDRSGKDFKQREKKADKIANEILGTATSNVHIAIERNQVNEQTAAATENEEEQFSTVVRSVNAYVPPGARRGVSSPLMANMPRSAMTPTATKQFFHPHAQQQPQQVYQSHNHQQAHHQQQQQQPLQQQSHHQHHANQAPHPHHHTQQGPNALNQTAGHRNNHNSGNSQNQAHNNTSRNSQVNNLLLPIPPHSVNIPQPDHNKPAAMLNAPTIAVAAATPLASPQPDKDISAFSSTEKSTDGSSTSLTSAQKVTNASTNKKDVVPVAEAYRLFFSNELSKAQSNKKQSIEKERSRKLSDLKQFGETFKLPHVIPQDIAAMVAPDEKRQREIMLQSAKDAREKQESLAALAALSLQEREQLKKAAPPPEVKKPMMSIAKIPPFKKKTPAALPSATTSDIKSSTATSDKKLNINAISFKPNPNAAAFTPGASLSAKSAAPSIPVNPFFGADIPTRTHTTVHVKEEFNIFKTGKVTESQAISQIWPFNGAPFRSQYPATATPSSPNMVNLPGQFNQNMQQQMHNAAQMHAQGHAQGQHSSLHQQHQQQSQGPISDQGFSAPDDTIGSIPQNSPQLYGYAPNVFRGQNGMPLPSGQVPGPGMMAYGHLPPQFMAPGMFTNAQMASMGGMPVMPVSMPGIYAGMPPPGAFAGFQNSMNGRGPSMSHAGYQNPMNYPMSQQFMHQQPPPPSQPQQIQHLGSERSE